MANGGYWHSESDWRRVEAPLQELDHDLVSFASMNELSLSKNHKDWPERSLNWGGTIKLLLQVYLADEQALTFNVWLCASQDREAGRYWKREFLIEARPVAEFRESFASLLKESKIKLESWSEDQLELATHSE
jgi:hypothetical protein